jgi:hypothetical protein
MSGSKVSWHRIIRVASLAAFAGGLGLLMHRLQRTPEQVDLTRYVQVELPSLLSAERPIHERIERLGQAPGLKPEEARKLLVDDVIPRLLKLKKGIEQVQTHTDETRALNGEYATVTDALIDACRNCVQVIDDPKVSTGEGWKRVRKQFADVQDAFQRWDEHVQAACVRNRLAKPTGH